MLNDTPTYRVKSPSYNLSKFLANILKNIENESINVKNSQQIISSQKSVRLEKDDFIFSVDAVSLFTCIPVSLATEIISEKLEELKIWTALDKDLFFDALKFCLENGYCKYENKCYAQ